jgi:DNA-binding beta-propeller fold protein YncE
VVIQRTALAVVAAASLLLGCAQDGPRQMRLDNPRAGEHDLTLWPRGAEPARYAYVGELTGENNFPLIEPRSTRIGASKLFAWLVGLGLDPDEPLVLQRPQGGLTDGDGRVLVTDVSHRAIFVFDPVNAQLRVWPFAAEGVPFVAPIAITIAGNGEVLVTDAELGAVYRLSPDGAPVGSFGSDVLVRPTGIARDVRRGRIFVADTRANDVKVFDEGGVLTDVIGRRGDSRGELNAPTYIAYSGDRLFVTDTLNSRIQVFDAFGQPARMFGERGLYVGNLARPKGIALDGDGNVYVVESLYDHLLVYDDRGRFMLPIGGTGKEPGQFYLPAGVWTDRNDRVFVADMFNGRVAVFQFLGGS